MTVFLLLPWFLRSYNSFFRLQQHQSGKGENTTFSSRMPEVELPVLTISEVDPPTEASLVSSHVEGEASLVSSQGAVQASLVSTDDQPVVTAVPVSIENLILVEEEKKE